MIREIAQRRLGLLKWEIFALEAQIRQNDEGIRQSMRDGLAILLREEKELEELLAKDENKQAA